MGRDKKGPFNVNHLATDIEVDVYDPAKGPACTIDAFRPDLAATPGSDWNVSVIHVFTQHYCSQNPDVDEDTVTSSFKDHLKYLCNRYKGSLDGEAAILRRQKHANRAERQRNLWQRRLATCAFFPELREHLAILQDLGPFGMSSDESDDASTGRVRYRIVRKLWRNEDVTAFLRILDRLYVIGRIASRSGSQPHERAESKLTSTSRPPVCGLPQNAYNQKWFGLLTDYDLLLLKPKMGVRYKFSHPPRIITLA
ncbi:hypothetical protein OH76DRAFT_1346290 [Lentinus brumalis]|uniref:Uncharacterized protein n=1 Tax=Lentinus brumalis TaxID=2498619 RepID=A0A371DH00_9APHY|nr:hypothetical protein OH76DRAFT_1346290 [Polyporus brumalis]